MKVKSLNELLPSDGKMLFLKEPCSVSFAGITLQIEACQPVFLNRSTPIRLSMFPTSSFHLCATNGFDLSWNSGAHSFWNFSIFFIQLSRSSAGLIITSTGIIGGSGGGGGGWPPPVKKSSITPILAVNGVRRSIRYWGACPSSAFRSSVV